MELKELNELVGKPDYSNTPPPYDEIQQALASLGLDSASFIETYIATIQHTGIQSKNLELIQHLVVAAILYSQPKGWFKRFKEVF